MTERKNLHKTYSKLYYCTAVFHAVFVVIFMLTHCPILMFLNVASIMLYLCLGTLATKPGSLKPLFNVCFTEIMLFSVITSIMAGWNCGFQLYILAILPLLFYSVFWLGKMDIKIAFRYCIGMVVIFYATMFVSFTEVLRVYRVSTASEHLLYAINISATFLLLISFLIVFISKVKLEAIELEQEKENIQSSANIDALTGLLNRRSFDEYIAKNMRDAYENRHSFSILMCDIDDFKAVNDTYGHECGDEVLKNVANALRRTLRDRDRIFRWGGEEILILLADDSEKTAVIADRCRRAVENTVTQFRNLSVQVTITVGCCSYFPGATKDDMINASDRNLYRGKNNGKNCVVI